MLTVKKNYAARDRFFWSDLPDAAETMNRLGNHLRTPQDQLIAWCANGYLTDPGAVPQPDVDALLHDAHAAVANPDTEIKMTYWDETGHHYAKAETQFLGKTEAKVLDLHTYLDSAAKLVFAPKILDFLTDIFQDDAVAFQCLFFEYGSQQGCHQDTAFVYVDPPYQFAASWIALEDVVPGSGELFYYPGSHRLDDLLFQSGTKALLGGDPDAHHYSSELERIAEAAGLTKCLLHIKKGDALYWSADLMHGGAPIQTRQTRRSLVTHYCPKKAIIPYSHHSSRQPRQVADRGWVIGQN